MSRTIVNFVKRSLCSEPKGSDLKWTDAELLRRFATGEDERGFAILFNRHAGMVLGICRRLLPTQQDAEDACQATFLILLRKAGSVKWQPSVASWLFTTARQVVANMKKTMRNRISREGRTAVPEANSPLDQISGREFLTILDEELDKLTPANREALILCYLEGLTRDEAAQRLGVPSGTIKIRTERGRKQLQAALSRRGCGLSVGLLTLAALSSARAVSPRLSESMLTVMMSSPSPAVMALADGVTPIAKYLTFITGLIMTVAATAGIGFALGTVPQEKQPTPESGSKSSVVKIEPKPVLDAFGEELPKGAIARLGSTRFRVGSWPKFMSPSPDGNKLVTIGTSVNGSESLTVWDSATGRAIRRFDYKEGKTDNATLLADGRGFAVVKVNETEYVIWEFTDTNATPPTMENQNARNGSTIGTFTSSAISPDGKLIAAGRRAGEAGNEGRLEIWPLIPNKKISEIKPRFVADMPGAFVGLSFTPDGKGLIGITQNRSPDQVGPKGEYVYGVSSDKSTITLWDVASGNVKMTCEAPKMAINQSSFDTQRPYVMTADGKTLFVSSQTGRITVLDLTKGRELLSFDAAVPKLEKQTIQSHISHIDLTPDGRTLLVVQYGNSIAGFDARTGKELWRNRERDAMYMYSFVALPDGKRFAMGCANGHVQFGDPSTGKIYDSNSGHTGHVLSVSIMDAGRTAFTAGIDGTVRRWDVTSGKERSHSIFEGFERLRWLYFAPGSQTAVGSGPIEGSSNWTTGIYDTKTGKSTARLLFANGSPVTVSILDVPPAWLPDGSVILPLGSEAVRFGADGKEIARYSGTKPGEPADELFAVSASPDGRTIILNGRGPSKGGWIGDSYVTVFDLASKSVRHRFKSTLRVRGATFTSDGSAVLVIGNVTQPSRQVGQPPAVLKFETAVTRLDLKTYETSTPYIAPKTNAEYRFISTIAVSSTGYQFAVAEGDYSITVYELGSGTIRHRFAGHKNLIQHLAFSSDGTKLISVSQDGTGLVWDIAPPRPTNRVVQTESARRARWDALTNSNAETAHKAMGEWMADPEAFVAYARKNVKIVTTMSNADLDTVIDHLDSEDFKERELASQTLNEQGSSAVARAQYRLDRAGSAEVRKRLESFINQHGRQDLLSSIRLQERRVVEVLELLQTKEAKALLLDFAQKGESPLSRDSKAAIERLHP